MSLFLSESASRVIDIVHALTFLFSGFVGSGGNVGSFVYGLGFRNMDYKAAFLMMGGIVIASSFLSVFIHIPCHAGMLWGEDNHTVLQARERYRLQRERARRAIEEQNQARHRGNRRDGGEGTVEGGATVESLEKGEHGSDGADMQEQTHGDVPSADEALQAKTS